MSELLNFIFAHEAKFRRERLPSLYSDFRVQRTINPDGYEANISTWLEALAGAASAGKLPTHSAQNDLLLLETGQELVRALETKEYGRPLALGAVINEGIQRKEMIPFQEFLTTPTSIYNRSWVITPWQILKWGLKQLGLAGGSYGEDRLSIGQFVLIRNVEVRKIWIVNEMDANWKQEAATKVLSKASTYSSRTDRVLSKDLFIKQYSKVLGEEHTLSESDINVLLLFLARDKGSIAYDGRTIKFKRLDESTVGIDEQDTTIASLKSLIANLTTQVDSLTNRVQKLSITAKELVAKGNRTSALAALRSKKLADSNLKTRLDTLAQLEEVYTKIEEATGQVEVVQIMEASARVLKGLHAEIGGADRVEDIIESLREEIGNVNEIGQIISEPLTSEAAIDEDELDDELAAMEGAAKEEKEKQEAMETERRLGEIGKGSRPIVEGQNVPPKGPATASPQGNKKPVNQDDVNETTAGVAQISMDIDRVQEQDSNIQANKKKQDIAQTA
ncbi:MAG: hypothetical protein M1834_005920 [Cirrosporium novae-zelandiae]|nr:MAG: hypothetical protein M1834_005920 [Cirrosporium novae-zelandiae]